LFILVYTGNDIAQPRFAGAIAAAINAALPEAIAAALPGAIAATLSAALAPIHVAIG
jgi:hypothetical protein